jgi:hypothetical protein
VHRLAQVTLAFLVQQQAVAAATQQPHQLMPQAAQAAQVSQAVVGVRFAQTPQLAQTLAVLVVTESLVVVVDTLASQLRLELAELAELV